MKKKNHYRTSKKKEASKKKIDADILPNNDVIISVSNQDKSDLEMGFGAINNYSKIAGALANYGGINDMLKAHRQLAGLRAFDNVAKLSSGFAAIGVANSLSRLSMGIAGVADISNRWASLNTGLVVGLAKYEALGKFSQLRTGLGAITGYNDYAGLAGWTRSKLVSMSVLDKSLLSTASINHKNSLLTSAIFTNIHKSALDFLDNSHLKYVASANVLSDYGKIAGLTKSAETMLSKFAWNDIGKTIQLHRDSKYALNKSFLSLSDEYSNLLKLHQDEPTSYFNVGLLTTGASKEFYTSAVVLEAISETEELISASDNIAKEIQYENEYSLNNYLPKIHPDLLNMWKGAVETFYSTNSDRTRQFTVSIRELFTHLMQRLAPDDCIKGWSTDPSLFHEGRPTRKARLKYICRNISSNSFDKFVEKDINATNEFIGIFQEGTHSLENKFSPYQVTAIKSKAETTLKFLLEIEFTANR